MKWHKCNSARDLKKFYQSRLPFIRTVAATYGYAIGVHGSLRRDFDLIAVPWREGHSTPDVLANAIQKAATGGITQTSFQWEKKPCGRIATSLPVCWCWPTAAAGAGHIDLSVIIPVYPQKERWDE